MDIWQQQLQQSITSLAQLSEVLLYPLSPGAMEALTRTKLLITPHTLSLIDKSDPQCPIARMCVPHEREVQVREEELVDPIGDDAYTQVPHLVHRYQDRVLVQVSYACAQQCRFCFRREKTGCPTPGPRDEDFIKMANYLREHPEVKEVILSGGDPLLLSDARLNFILSLFASVETVERLRIHTRMPAVLPSRLTEELLSVFAAQQKELTIVTHFNHPKELAQETVQVLRALKHVGVRLKNQSVLLAGVNDKPEILQALFEALRNAQVELYYLHQLDLALGTNQFRVPIVRGKEIMKELRTKFSVGVLPVYVLDIPGGGGKIPIESELVSLQHPGIYELTDRFGNKTVYKEPKNTENLLQ
jgi:lysine 2,3-aminomutase